MSVKGIVFDIQRFSLHDGPGIRTTVFLKGCPLRCKWCHNPESWLQKPQLKFNEEKCTNCLACVSVCPTKAHIAQSGIHRWKSLLCKEHFCCVQKCTYDALNIVGYETDVNTVIQTIEADNVYYSNSGGGLTVSGGEPMLQFEFSAELLKEAKKRGIHTCMETSGFVEDDKFSQILHYTDLFLFDIKHTDNHTHKEMTGVSNEKIYQNLDLLYKNGASIILRFPLVPDINDTDKHLIGIVELSERYPALEGIEILPYHDMGRGKWKAVGKEYSLQRIKNPTEEIKNLWIDKLIKLGCTRAFIAN